MVSLRGAIREFVAEFSPGERRDLILFVASCKDSSGKAMTAISRKKVAKLLVKKAKTTKAKTTKAKRCPVLGDDAPLGGCGDPDCDVHRGLDEDGFEIID